MKKKTFWAVITNGELIYREASGQMSVFKDKKLAEFLAYDWIDPSEKPQVVKVRVETLDKKLK